MKRTLYGLVLLVLACGSANAALLSRLSGQAYYDDLLDITWVADANLSQTSGYDSDGRLGWTAAQAWIASLNTAAYLGKSDWRLPFMVDTGAAGCTFGYSGTDCGYNVQTVSGSTVFSEMATLFQVTLGNPSFRDSNTNPTGCNPSGPILCLANTGPFSNIQQYNYWFGTDLAPFTTDAWYYSFAYGQQSGGPKTGLYHAWAVRDGDIGVVPVPAAVYLFGSALGVMGWLRRKANPYPDNCVASTGKGNL